MSKSSDARTVKISGTSLYDRTAARNEYCLTVLLNNKEDSIIRQD